MEDGGEQGSEENGEVRRKLSVEIPKKAREVRRERKKRER